MDIDTLLEKTKKTKAECLTEREIKWVCDKIKELLIEESNVQPV